MSIRCCTFDARPVFRMREAAVCVSSVAILELLDCSSAVVINWLGAATEVLSQASHHSSVFTNVNRLPLADIYIFYDELSDILLKVSQLVDSG